MSPLRITFETSTFAAITLVQSAVNSQLASINDQGVQTSAHQAMIAAAARMNRQKMPDAATSRLNPEPTASCHAALTIMSCC